ncbi:hypothetical protein HMPREF9946_01717 [Acetobacteraceae bacterium AT-5844]|nr:hypothetical protein HMPREF9946_01717 [Acetobacteraceae bacterium AT-5844]
MGMSKALSGSARACGGGGDGKSLLPSCGDPHRGLLPARSAGTLCRGSLGGDARAAGGNRRSTRIEAHAALILDFLEQKSDIALGEIRAELAKAGMAAGITTIWRLFRRHGSGEKNSARRGAGPPGYPEAALGLVREPARPRTGPPGVHR